MRVKKLLFYLLVVLLGGCVPVMSLHSLYTKENVVFEEKLLGTWVDDPNSPESIWEFKRVDDPKNVYKLIFSHIEGPKRLICCTSGEAGEQLVSGCFSG